MNIDGEALWSKHVNFDLIPGGVNFLVPANMAFFHPETTGGHETREFVHPDEKTRSQNVYKKISPGA